MRSGIVSSLRSPAIAALALALPLVAACTPGERPTRFVVMAVDGAEWSVIEQLWEDGRLPNLRRLAERGVRSHLATDYGKSPVIWTTVATGQPPDTHGIEAFAVETERGRIPVSSATRRAPALWNILTRRERSVAVLGWWASWPAEPVQGVMVSDRAARTELDRRAFPATFESEVDALLEEIRQRLDEQLYPLRAGELGPAVAQDVLVEELAPRLAAADYELLLVYLRSVDLMSHKYWKFWEPERYRDLGPHRGFDAETLAHRRDWIPATYERVDRVVGRLVEAAPEANFLVLSDHGFGWADYLRITTDFDRLLERLGYLSRDESGEIDMPHTTAFTVDTVPHHPPKRARLARSGEVPGGTLSAEEARRVRAELIGDLQRLRFETGRPVFRVEPASPDAPFDVEATLLDQGLTETLVLDGRRLEGIIESIEHISGGHGETQAGIFLAAGPDLDPGAKPGGISIHDITPTLLYGLGLPVAEDGSGRAWRELFAPGFREVHPSRTVASYGVEEEGETRSSEADAEIVEELKALGYLD